MPVIPMAREPSAGSRFVKATERKTSVPRDVPSDHSLLHRPGAITIEKWPLRSGAFVACSPTGKSSRTRLLVSMAATKGALLINLREGGVS
jgi:hypothetical protein